MSAKDLKELLEHLDDTHELVLGPLAEPEDELPFPVDELLFCWRDAADEAACALRLVARASGRGGLRRLPRRRRSRRCRAGGAEPERRAGRDRAVRGEGVQPVLLPAYDRRPAAAADDHGRDDHVLL
jgi:hypothetical protein